MLFLLYQLETDLIWSLCRQSKAWKGLFIHMPHSKTCITSGATVIFKSVVGKKIILESQVFSRFLVGMNLFSLEKIFFL